MVVSSQLRAGMAIRHEGHSYKIVAADYHPGQGKMGGVTHARLLNLDTGTQWETSFRADLKFDEVELEKKALEFLYADGDQCWFMHPETFEQFEVPRALIGPQAAFLEPGMKVNIELVEGRPAVAVFPDFLEVRIADTAPAVHQQQDGAYKQAKLANGVEIMVPQFIKSGDLIRLDMQTLKYMDRVKVDVRAKGS
jgi:elongation factor P